MGGGLHSALTSTPEPDRRSRTTTEGTAITLRAVHVRMEVLEKRNELQASWQSCAAAANLAPIGYSLRCSRAGYRPETKEMG
jgi:hypothetical protein